MSYGNIISINSQTGVKTEVPVDNTWILANKPSRIVTTIENTSKAVGESETISIQLVTPELVDGTQEDVQQGLTVTMQFGDDEQVITLDENGAWSDTLEFIEAGDYVIRPASHPGNEITVGVS